MIVKIKQQDSDAPTNDYFDAMRQKNYEASFEGVKNFIQANKAKQRQRRSRKPLPKWQWVLAVLFPVLIVLACTKTERSEPVGQTVTFSVPVGDGAAIQALEPIIGGWQRVIVPDGQKPGFLSYTTFIPAQSSRSAAAVLNQLRAVKGLVHLSAMPLQTKVRESLLSQLHSKIFSTHIDAASLSDEEMQNTINRQLKEQGFNHITVSFTRNEKGVRTLQLHPGNEGPNVSIDVSLDDNGTTMILQEEKGGTPATTNSTNEPEPDFGRMTDAQVRAYVRRRYGRDQGDEAIKVTRTADEIAISIKKSNKQEEIMRFKLH